MKLPSLSVKRRPAKQPVFRKLFANVRRQQRAAVAAPPAAEAEGDVPNLGIARALAVILVIHVVAIAGIFAHSRWFEKDGAKLAVANVPLIEQPRPPRDAGVPQPKIEEGDSTYMPVAGDNYAKIADECMVSEAALRKANNNMEISPGRTLIIPPRTIVAVDPPELARLRQGAEAENAQAAVAVPVDEIRDAPMVDAAPLLVRPSVSRPGEARATEATVGRSIPVAAPADAPTAGARKYTVKAGDTFWKIAQAHKSTPDKIMKANRITDPKKLKAGMQLMVP